jgi:hypothetical protein
MKTTFWFFVHDFLFFYSLIKLVAFLKSFYQIAIFSAVSYNAIFLTSVLAQPYVLLQYIPINFSSPKIQWNHFIFPKIFYIDYFLSYLLNPLTFSVDITVGIV